MTHGPSQLPTFATIPDILRWRVSLTPKEIACHVPDESGGWTQLTWSEYAARIDCAAAALTRLGLVPGDTIAILAKTSLRWEIANHAILAEGGVVVGIEAHSGIDQIAHILEHSGAAAIFFDDPGLWSKLPLPIRAAFRFAVCMDDAAPKPDGVHAWNALAVPRSLPSERRSPQSTDPASIVYTSGTTGRSKGILYSHAQVVTACLAIGEVFPQLPPGASTLCWLPLANLFQRMANLNAIVTGQQTWFVRDPRAIMDVIQEVQPAIFIGVPRFYDKLYTGMREKLGALPGPQKHLVAWALRVGQARVARRRAGKPAPALHGIADRLVLRGLRARLLGGGMQVCYTGSAPIRLEVLEFFHAIGLCLMEAYALSENIVPMAVNTPQEFRLGSVGKPLRQNRLRIDAEGEIRVAGPGVFNGYFREEKNPEQWDGDGYYRTGDVGRLDDAGFLYLSGRRSEIIKTSTGRRVAPAAIEAAYRGSPLIDDIIVVGHGRPHLAALIVPAAAATRDAIQADLNRLGGNLASYEQVRGFALLQQPFSIERGELTNSLKMRRSVIEERYRETIEGLYS